MFITSFTNFGPTKIDKDQIQRLKQDSERWKIISKKKKKTERVFCDINGQSEEMFGLAFCERAEERLLSSLIVCQREERQMTARGLVSVKHDG